MLVLQPRDKKILSLLSKFGVLSTRQISALCFVNTSHTTVMRRLRMLEAEDIILRLTGHSQGLGVWCLTTKGANLGGLPQPFRYGNRNTLEHDVTVSELRLSLEGEGLGLDWISESEMKRERGIEYGGRSIEALVPDGIFTFTNDDVPKVVAVEAELSPKNHSRYDKLFHQYARKNSLDYVWYITANASISNLIARRWAQSLRYNFSPALILSTVDEVVNSPRSSNIFAFDEEENIRLDEFFALPLIEKPSSRGEQADLKQLSTHT